MDRKTWVRFECGVENRMSKDYGPFEYLQIVYNNLTTTDGIELASYDPTTSKWHLLKHSGAWGDILKMGGLEFDEKDLEKWWSDFVVWGYEGVCTNCPSCGSQKFEEEIVVNEFPYGVDWDAVTLAVTEPQMFCHKCQFIWTDYRSEQARDALVKHHKNKKEQK